MKLAANVEINNRLHPSLNISGRRSQWATLTVGKEPGASSSVFILYQTAQNKTGTKYHVMNNIERVFTRFVNEGKATIRFKNPPHDVCIRCDPLQLKLFLKTLKSGMLKKVPDKNAMLSNITSTTKMLAAPKTKLVVDSKASFPTVEGFPRTLVSLDINNAEQRRLDRRVLGLKHLKVLKLINNNLTALPESLGSLLSLEVLCVSHNKFGKVPVTSHEWDWMSDVNMIKTLHTLDLSYNEMDLLPNQICKLKRLISLNVAGNKLTKLPSSLGRLYGLRFLSAGHNLLKYLPGSLRKLRFESLDLAENAFDPVTADYSQDQSMMKVPTLLEIAARRVLNLRLFYSAEVVPGNVVMYLDNAHYCPCGSACFETSCRKMVPLELKKISSTVIVSHGGYGAAARSTVVPAETYFCSRNCSYFLMF